jgi:tetratricopeptide (TPR) repeat protein
MVHVAETLRHYRKALELLDSVPDSPETLGLAVTARAGLLGSAAFTPVSQEELERVFEEGKALAQQSHDPKALAELLSAYSAAQTSSGNADAALEHALEAVRLAIESGDTQFETGLRVGTMFAYYGAGRLRDAVEYAAESYDRVKGEGAFRSDPIGPENLASRGFRAMLLTHMGRLEEAERDLLRVLQIAGDLGKSFSWMRGNLVDLAFFSGRVETALAQARLGLEEAQQYGSTYFVATAYRALGVAHSLNEDWDEAIQALELSLNLIRETRSALHLEGAILAALAETYLAAGEPSRALELAAEAVTVSRHHHTRLYECRALWTRAHVLRATEGAASAQTISALLDEATELIGETGATSYAPFIQVERAELAQALENAETHERALREARRLFLEIGAPVRAEKIEELAATAVASPEP